jgi:RNA polymerase sigma-70 factor (ECF subfamily)
MVDESRNRPPDAEQPTRGEHASEITATSSSLLRFAASGDENAWAKMVNRYGPMVRKHCLHAGLSAADADCLSQDVFSELFLRIGKFSRQRPGSFRRWLGMLVHSRIIDHIRQVRRRRKEHSAAMSRLPSSGKAVAADESGSSRSVRSEILKLIRHDYSDRDWQIFYMYVGLEQSPEEIANELGVSRNTVYLVKSRIIRSLQSRLKPMRPSS